MVINPQPGRKAPSLQPAALVSQRVAVYPEKVAQKVLASPTIEHLRLGDGVQMVLVLVSTACLAEAATCLRRCPLGQHYQPEFKRCEKDKRNKDQFCGCFEYELMNSCKQCPTGFWVGDVHHRGTKAHCRRRTRATSEKATSGMATSGLWGLRMKW